MNSPSIQQAATLTAGQTTRKTEAPSGAFLQDMTQQLNNSDALLTYLIGLNATGQKNWFGFQQQRLAGIDLAYRIAVAHADKMTPAEVIKYVVELNNEIYDKMLKG